MSADSADDDDAGVTAGGALEIHQAPVPEGGDPVKIGRFAVEGRVGEGGMGVVYLAHDPTIDRKVAIKRLRRREGGSGGSVGRGRLVREAQAMGKLVHPNVATVYEVGELRRSGEVYIVMEYVRGGTLGDWLKARPRTRAEIFAMFLGAGRGLLAAHDAGLIHRDFKPANVLVSEDGQAKVTDFGLVGAPGAASGDTPPPSVSPTSWSQDSAEKLTSEGQVLGTPMFMAPEQHAGRAVDARADQYAFAAALYMALAGHAPFAGDSLEALAEAKRAERLAPIAERVPRRIRRALARALHRDPEARWPSMRALVDALAAALAPRVTPLRAAAVALGVAVVAGTVWLAARRGAQPCRGAAERLAGVWDARVRADVERAYARVGAAWATADSPRLAHVLDGYADAWVAAHTDACLATAVRREQSPATLDLRMRCLDRRLGGLRALTGVLTREGAKLDRAVAAALRLEPIADCDDVTVLAAGGAAPPPAAQRVEVEALRARVAEVRTYLSMGNVRAARGAGETLVPDARRIGYAPLLAEALLLRAEAIEDSEPKQAEQLYNEAVAQAGDLRDDAETAHTELGLFSFQARHHHDREAMALRPAVDAAIRRVGGPDALWSSYHKTLGEIQELSGQHQESIKSYETALAESVRAYGGDSVPGARIHKSLGAVYITLAKVDQARAEAQKAHEVLTRLLGEDAVDLADVDATLGVLAVRDGDYVGGRALFQRAFEIAAEHDGERSALAATYRYNLGLLSLQEGKLEPARVDVAKALAIREEVLGPRHPDVAIALFVLGEIDLRLGHLDAAGPSLERSLAIQEETLAPDHINLSYSLDRLSDLRQKQGRAAEAVPLVERSYAIRQKGLGPDHPDTIDTAATLSYTYMLVGRSDDAVRVIEPVEKALRAEVPPKVRADVRFQLARALHAAKREPARALALAKRARAEAAEDPGAEETLADIDEWLKKL